MITPGRYTVVLVTAPNVKTARTLAQAALAEQLVACANLIPKVESHYWWQGKIEISAEVLILFKTIRSKLKALEETVLRLHPYDTPEFVVLDIASGNRRYLAWLGDSLIAS